MERESPYTVVAKYQENLPVDLDAIARDLGIKVFRVDLGEHISGQIIRDKIKGGFSGFMIYINSSDYIGRQRFSFAHELAHYILHRDLIDSGVIDDTLYRSAQLDSRFEAQANRMAADILMPIMKVKDVMARGITDIKALSKLFQVSPAAMKIRIDNLKRPPV